MRFFILIFGFGFAQGLLKAQTNGWQPPAGHSQVLIWPGAAPDGRPVAGPEIARTTGLNKGDWRTVVFVDRVTQPTMTVFSPKGTNTGVAVVIFPGGGYNELAIDLEGTEVCDWLNSKGITGVLLKYRVPGMEHYTDGKYPRSGAYPRSPIALEDAQRTMGLVRLHAAEWHIDPRKIGVLGFSAGGHLVAAISTHFNKRLYRAVDAADKESCRPDFAVALYPGHMLEETPDDDRLNPYIPFTTNTPPTFLVQAENDPVDTVTNSLVYYSGLKNARVPAEMHLYAEGGHGFGLRPTKLPITNWPELAEKWLRTIGMIAE
jgi:acetyl esterase/lipase